MSRRAARLGLVVAAAQFLFGCGTECAQTPDLAVERELELALQSYVDGVRLGLESVVSDKWIDVYLRKRLTPTNSDPGNGEDAWLAGVLDRASTGLVSRASARTVADCIAACDVLVVTDIHSCLLHQAAYWTLVGALESHSALHRRRVLCAIEGLTLDQLDANGQILSDEVRFSSYWDVSVLLDGLKRRWTRESKFARVPMSRYREFAAEAKVRTSGAFDWRQVGADDVAEVNRGLVATLRAVAGHARGSTACVIMGLGHAHASPFALVGGLRDAGLRVAVVHPYVPELAAHVEVQSHVLDDAWVQIGPDEYLAPLPREVGVALGILPEAAPQPLGPNLPR